MILPALTLGLVLYGDYALIVRSAMLETLGEDYVLTARAKGLKNWTIVRRHGLRNAMLPIITLVALSLGFIIGGSITVEYVFSYPGLGLLTVEAIDKRDFPLLQAIFMLLTLSVIVFNLIADLLYFKFDPAGDAHEPDRAAPVGRPGCARRGDRPERTPRLRADGDPRQPPGDGRARRGRCSSSSWRCSRRGSSRTIRQPRRAPSTRRRAARTGSAPTTAASTCSR